MAIRSMMRAAFFLVLGLVGVWIGLVSTVILAPRTGLGWFIIPSVFVGACAVLGVNELGVVQTFRSPVRALTIGVAIGSAVNGLLSLWPIS